MSPARAPSQRSGVQSIDRAVAILSCFNARQPELGITEIAQMTGLSTSTTHRLLAAMQVHRLVRQTSARRYRVGVLVVQLAHSGAAPTELLDAALASMQSLRDEVNETVGLHELLPSGERAVIAQAESYQQLRRCYTEIGVPIGLVHGSPGKAILCMLPLPRQEVWLARPIAAVTERTVTDPERLREELAAARQRGWAGSNEERTPGIRSVAAPLFDHSSRVVGSLSLSVPTIRMDDARADQLGERAKETAWQISELLGATRAGVQKTVEAAGGSVDDAGD